jgi:hypothetical protein
METPLALVGHGELSSDYEYYGWSDPVPWMASADYARFGAGVGTGNVNEIGWSANNLTTPISGSPNLCIRHLTPETIVKGATDILDIWYKPYWYFDITDGTGSIALGGQTYDWTARWLQLNGARQSFTQGYTSHNILTQTISPRSYCDGDLVSAFADHGTWSGNISAVPMYTNSPFPAPLGTDHWVDCRVGINVDGVLPTEELRLIAFSGWIGNIGIQVRFGRQGGGDERIPFTNKDIFWTEFRWHYDRYVPDLWAPIPSFDVTGADMTPTHNP